MLKFGFLRSGVLPMGSRSVLLFVATAFVTVALFAASAVAPSAVVPDSLEAKPALAQQVVQFEGYGFTPDIAIANLSQQKDSWILNNPGYSLSCAPLRTHETALWYAWQDCIPNPYPEI